MPHPTKLIRHGPFEADVDEGLAALVLALWQRGIETCSACQDEAESDAEVGGEAAAHGRAYVEFVSLDDALRFYDAVAAARPPRDQPADPLDQRMTNFASPGAWEARIAIYDRRITEDTGALDGPARFAPGVVRVRFPAADIAEITARLDDRIERS